MGLDNINEVSAMADRLSIPQLQQAMRDGTLPAYVGLPILQQKAKLQKQMQSAAMVQQPKAPTVAQQVESQTADQARQNYLANMLQGGEAPEYADGGIVAFDLGGRVPSSYSQKKVVPLSQLLLGEAEPLYPEQVVEQRAPVQPEDRADYSELEALRRKQRGESPTPVPAIVPTLWEDIKSGASKIVPTGADIAELKDYFSKIPAEQQATVTQQPTPVQAAPVQQPQTPAQPTVAAPTQPQAQPTVAEVNRVGAHRMMGAEAVKQGMANVGTGGPANFLNPAAVEQIAAQTQSQTQAPSEQEAPVTVASAAKEYRDYLGEDAGVSKMQKQLDQMRADKEAGKDSSLWNALMMGGLQYAGGANLGQAGTAGLNVWTEGQKEARKQEEKFYGLQNDLEQARRAADVKAADYGFKSKEAADARKHAEKLQAQKDAADYKRAIDTAKINAETQKEVMQGYAGAKVAAAEARGAGGASKASQEDIKKYNALLRESAAVGKQISNTLGFNPAKHIEHKALQDRLDKVNSQVERYRTLMTGGEASAQPAPTGGASIDRNAIIEALRKRGL